MKPLIIKECFCIHPSSNCRNNLNAIFRTYDIPFGMDWLRGQAWAQYIPFLPTFQVNTFPSYPPSRLIHSLPPHLPG